MSLRWRIALGLAAIAALVSAFGATAAYLNAADQLRTSVDQSLLSQARDPLLTRGPGRPGDHDHYRSGASPECPLEGSLQPANAAQIVHADGGVVPCFRGGTALPVDRSLVTLVLKNGVARLATVSTKAGAYRTVTVARPDGSALQLGRSMEENNDILNSLRVRLALFAVGGVLAAAALGWLFATRIVAPIERLRASAEAIARTGDLDGAMPPAGSGEVGSLTTSFATMVGALAESRRRQHQLVTDASHELRTPLTSLQTNAELLDRGDRLTEAQRDQVSEGIRFEVRELTDLVSELVDLARDPASDAEPIGPVALGPMVAGIADAARRRTDRDITTEVEHPVQLTGRAKALTRAVANLVDNAIKHGEGPIEVTADRGTVAVRDHGPGIAPADLPNVFERFYRADVARTEPGSGLGLAIVAQVVERHGGSAFARNHPDGGAVVGFTLPTG